MGKGFNNYMTKKFFHPSSKDNIKRVWMAQQKTEFEKKKQEDMLAQYQKEQEMYGNRALLGDEKAKLGLNFLYDAPPGLKTKEKEDDEPEYKFEWQRKYNAPREAYAKDDETIRDQPFGIEVRNVRCIKCRQWGHVNTDKICPLFGKNLTAEPPQPGQNTKSLVEGMKEDGFQMKRNLVGNISETAAASQGFLDGADDNDPEVQFLRSLTPEQKKKLLKKLNKLKKKQKEKKRKKKSKHSKRKKDGDSEKRHKKKRRSSSSSEDSDSSSDSDDSSPVRRKHRKRSHSSSSSSSEVDTLRQFKASLTAGSEHRSIEHNKTRSDASHFDREQDRRKRSDMSYDESNHRSRSRDNTHERKTRDKPERERGWRVSSESETEDRTVASDRHERRDKYRGSQHRDSNSQRYHYKERYDRRH